jgi:hypothetical protein
MKTINFTTLKTPTPYLYAISLLFLAGCTQWNSDPMRLQADYGNSVRAMVNNQIYNPKKSQTPAALAPDGMEANKADTILNGGNSYGGTGYRTDIGQIENVGHSALGKAGLATQGGGSTSGR